jgi:hypothetical protein
MATSEREIPHEPAVLRVMYVVVDGVEKERAHVSSLALICL